MRNNKIRIDDLDDDDGQPGLNRLLQLSDEDLLTVAGGALEMGTPVLSSATGSGAGGDTDPLWERAMN